MEFTSNKAARELADRQLERVHRVLEHQPSLHGTVDRAFAHRHEALRGVVGSTALGTAIEGTDDRDEMGVFVEPIKYVVGLQSADHMVYRDAGEGQRSRPDDLDLTMYSLRKYCRLAVRGNPSIILLLWLPTHIVCTRIGRDLLGLRNAFVSKDTAARFLGFMSAQRRALTGERSARVARPEVIEQHGFDTKFAMHALRLGLQGIELLDTGGLRLPMEQHRELLLAIRTGQVPYDEVLRLITDTEAQLAARVEACTWAADVAAVEKFLVQAHRDRWAGIP